MKELFGVMEVFYVMIVVITHIYTFVKCMSSYTLKIGKLYLNEDLKKLRTGKLERHLSKWLTGWPKTWGELSTRACILTEQNYVKYFRRWISFCGYIHYNGFLTPTVNQLGWQNKEGFVICSKRKFHIKKTQIFAE